MVAAAEVADVLDEPDRVCELVDLEAELEEPELELDLALALAAVVAEVAAELVCDLTVFDDSTTCQCFISHVFELKARCQAYELWSIVGLISLR